MTAKVVPLPITVKLVCSSCGAPGEGSCRCGAPYELAAARVAAYDKANPGRSTRQAGADLGISHTEVRRSRAGGTYVPPGKGSSGDAKASPAKVKGRDGKSYPATKAKTKSVMKTEIENFLAWAEGLLSSDTPDNIMEELKELTARYGAVEMEGARKKIKQYFRTMSGRLLKLAQQISEE